MFDLIAVLCIHAKVCPGLRRVQSDCCGYRQFCSAIAEHPILLGILCLSCLSVIFGSFSSCGIKCEQQTDGCFPQKKKIRCKNLAMYRAVLAYSMRGDCSSNVTDLRKSRGSCGVFRHSRIELVASCFCKCPFLFSLGCRRHAALHGNISYTLA